MEQLQKPLNIDELRERLAQFKAGRDELEFLHCSNVAGGIPRGVISEITGSARTEWVLRFLKENPTLITFWLEESFTILPTAIHQRGIDLQRILMAEAGPLLFQTLRKALKSKLFNCVVLPGVTAGAADETKILKALQLFARESNAVVLFLSKRPKSAWAIPFQLEATWDQNNDSLSVSILKSKLRSVQGDFRE